MGITERFIRKVEKKPTRTMSEINEEVNVAIVGNSHLKSLTLLTERTCLSKPFGVEHHEVTLPVYLSLGFPSVGSQV